METTPYIGPYKWKPICSRMEVGNPYTRLLHPTPCCNYVNSVGRTGFRRGLLNYPWFVDAKAGHIIVSERDSHKLQLFDLMGAETKYQPHGRYGYGKNEFISPGGVTTTKYLGANVIVVDSGNRRVQFKKKDCDYQGNGLLETTFEFGKLIFQHPMGVEFDNTRDFLMVTDTGKRKVTLHDMRTGTTIGEMRQPRYTPLLSPTDVAIDRNGCTYVTDSANGVIHFYDRNGNFIRLFGKDKLKKPWGLTFDRQDNLLVTDETGNSIHMYKEGGDFNRTITENIYLPKGITVNRYEFLVVATGDPYNFLKIVQYK